MKKEKILIIEDHKNIAKLIEYNLDKSGYVPLSVNSGEEALEILDKEEISLIILDIMLPGMDGFEVCRNIKQENRLKNIPIIMLTAKGEEVDRIVGLELGVDDYIVKPFSPRELVLRVKAILRRGKIQETTKDVLTAGIITVDIARHKVTVENEEINLTPREFKLLVILIERYARVQSREALLSQVWDIHSNVYTRTVDTHIKRLRQKLGKAGDFIQTVIGVGYKFQQQEDEN